MDRITTLGANYSNLRVQALTQFLELQKKLAKPKVGICDMQYYLAYGQQVGGGSELANYAISRTATFKGDRPVGTLDVAGPPDLAFFGVPILLEVNTAVPATYTAGTDMHINWIDTDFFHVVVDPRWNFKMYKPRARAGNDEQFVDIWRVVFRCTTRCYKREAHGVSIIDL